MIAAGILTVCIAVACLLLALIEPIRQLLITVTENLSAEVIELPSCPDDLSQLDTEGNDA